MQLFRSQLSRFAPHPHRDSWMRNNLKDWCFLLQLCSFITLLSSAWLNLNHGSPIGELINLKSLLANWFPAIDEKVLEYFFIGISTILALAGLFSLKFISPSQTAFMFVIILASLIQITAASIYFLEAQLAWNEILPVILPVISPILLIAYLSWRNQVDHWSVIACIAIAANIIGYSISQLNTLTGFINYSGDMLILSHVVTEKTEFLVSLSSYLAIVASILLFIPKFRRLVLYMFIICGIMWAGSSFIGSYAESLSYALVITLFQSSYWILPLLVLLSLASLNKSKTLKLRK